MKWEVAKRSIDYYVSHSKNNKILRFNFYGGEPLKNFCLIKKCVIYILSTVNKKCEFYITTNLTIMSDEIIDFLYMHDFSVMVSLDGPIDIHDRNRIKKDGTGTYSLIRKNLEYIKRNNKKFYSAIVFNAVLVDDIDYPTVKNFFLNDELFQNENGKRNEFIISAPYLGYCGDYKDNVIIEKSSTRNAINKFKRNLQISKEYVLTFLFSFKNITIERREEFYSFSELAAWMEDFQNDMQNSCIPLEELGHPCGVCYAGSTRLMVDTEGVFWPCEKVNTNNKKFSIGNLEMGIDISKVYEMLNISYEYQPCKTCYAFRYCNQCASTCSNSSKVDACRGSLDEFERRLRIYCNVCNINDKYVYIHNGYSKNSDKIDIDEIINFLVEDRKFDIVALEYIESPLLAAYSLYEMILILISKYNLKITGEDIINYTNFYLFLKKLILRSKE